MRCRLVAYYRVSTDKQGIRGLGIESQQTAVAAYAKQTACEVVGSYTEVESGRKRNRPELIKAIAHARKSRATLVVAKLDRLARNVAFLSSLMDSDLDFVALDCPDVGRLTVHILAAVAEEEARLISTRTKAALASLKARGVLLGRPENLTDEARQRGAATIRDRAVTDYNVVTPLVQLWRAEGLSLRAIAGRLNERGITTRTGSAWQAPQVKRVLDRAGD